MIGFLAAALSASNASAQDSSTAASGNTEATTTSPQPVQLSAGVQDVLKLVQSKIGDDTILAFIHNSGAAYRLGASDIIYLRGQGASDAIITAMLNQHGNTPVAPAPAVAAPVTTPRAAPPQSSAGYVAAAPTYVQPSTVYAASPAPDYSYYYQNYGYYYPYSGYYYPYYGYYYPSLSLSLGFGYGGYYGYYYGGGYHGGGDYHNDGGYHGGGGVPGGGPRGGGSPGGHR